MPLIRQPPSTLAARVPKGALPAAAALPEGTRFSLLARVIDNRKGEHREVLQDALKSGYAMQDTAAVCAVMEKMASRIPGAQYVLLQGCGHLGPMDQPAAFNDALHSFLIGNNL